MANKVTLKRSSVQGKAPQTSDLDYGEVALNFTDGRLYFRNSNDQIEFFERVDVNVKNNLNALLNNIDTNVLTSDGTFTADTLVLASYPNTSLPSPDTRGELIYVDNSGDYIESGYVEDGYAPEGGIASEDTIAFSNGEEWRQFSRVALSGEYDDLLNVPPSTQVSDSPPSSPIEGTLWWDTTDGNLYIYYQDDDSSQWVSATATTVGPRGENGEGVPEGGDEGQILRKLSNSDYDTEWSSDNYEIITDNYTARPRQRLLADTTTQSWTLILPQSPNSGNYIIVADGNDWGVNNLIVNGNGETIEGFTEDLTFDVGGYHVTLIYNGVTWRVFM